MKKIFNENSYQRFHFIGIGGISMSALAKYLVAKGKQVSGSDRQKSFLTSELKSLGVKVYYKHKAENINDAQVVIYSSAIDENNKEYAMAKEKGLDIFSRSEVLGGIVKNYDKCIAVSGSHGKTTTTCMIAEILERASLNPTVMIGGESLCFGNFKNGGSQFAVVEACEYKRNFLNILPFLSVVLNIDDDHLDTYGSIENEIEAFSKFIENSLSIINKDDKNASSIKNEGVIYYSAKQKASVRAKYVKFNGKGYSFTLYLYGVRVGRINLEISGKHNLYNALASIAVCVQLGVSFNDIKFGLENYHGVKRRNEFIGRRGKTEIYSDYAHHPTEIKAITEGYDKKTLVVFQPHTYSRTKFLMNDFVKNLSSIENLVIYKTYSAREKKDEKGSAFTLYNRLKEIRKTETIYSSDYSSLIRYLNGKIKKFNKVVFLGAGDIYEIAKKFANSQKTS